MNAIWKEILGAAGAVFDNDSVSHFGNAAEELAAAGKGTVLCPADHLGLIRVAGEDAKTFLHSQLTSDINHLGGDVVQHSAWCSAKGRMVASFVIWREGDDYILALSSDLVEAIAKRLQMYVLRAKVTVSVLNAERVLIGVAGPQAEAALAGGGLPVPVAMKSAGGDRVTVLRLDHDRFLVSVALERATQLWQQLQQQARPVGCPVWQWLDIRAGLPLVTAATREHFVPQMANFERLGGVSFHKGCYPGQEIVARTQYLGKVKRHLYRLSSEAAMAAGDELYSEAVPDQSCGMVVTATSSPAGGHEALAVLMEAVAEGGVRLRARDGAAATAAVVAA